MAHQLTERQIALLVKNKPSPYFEKINSILSDFESVIQGFSPEVFALDQNQLFKIPIEDLIFFKDYEMSLEIFSQRQQWLPLLQDVINSEDLKNHFKTRDGLLLRLTKLESLQDFIKEFIITRESATSVERSSIVNLARRIIEEAKSNSPEKLDSTSIEEEITNFSEKTKKIFRNFVGLPDDQIIFLEGIEIPSQTSQVLEKLNQKIGYIKQVLQHSVLPTELSVSKKPVWRAQLPNLNSILEFEQNNQVLNKEDVLTYLGLDISESMADLSTLLESKKSDISLYIWSNANDSDNNNFSNLLQLQNFYRKENVGSKEIHLLYLEALGKYSLLFFHEQRNNNFSLIGSALSNKENEEIESFILSARKAEKQLAAIHQLPQEQLNFFENQVNKLLMLGSFRIRYHGQAKIRQQESDSVKKIIGFLQDIEGSSLEQRNVFSQFKALSSAQQRAVLANHELNDHHKQYLQDFFKIGAFQELSSAMTSVLTDFRKLRENGIYYDKDLFECTTKLSQSYLNMLSLRESRSLYHELCDVKLNLPTQENSASPRYSRNPTKLYLQVKKIVDDHITRGLKINVSLKNKFFNEAHRLQIRFLDEALKRAKRSEGYQDQTLIEDIIFLVGNGEINRTDQMGAMVHVVYIDRLIINNHKAQEKKIKVNFWKEQDPKDLETLFGKEGDQWLLHPARLQQEAKFALLQHNEARARCLQHYQKEEKFPEQVKKELQSMMGWFEVLVGQPYPEEQKESERDQLKIFIKKRSLQFKWTILEQQIELLEQSRNLLSGHPQDPEKLNKDVENLLSKAMSQEINLLSEHLTRPHQLLYWRGERLNINSDTLQKYINQFESEYMTPVEKAYNLTFDSESDLDNHISDLENKFRQIKAETRKLDIKTNRNEHRLDDLKKKHQELAEKLSTLYSENALPCQYRQQFSEIAEPLLESAINVHYQYEGGNTLMHLAFQGRNPEAAMILLERNPDILKENNDGLSVFALGLEDLKNPAMDAMNEHLKRSIEDIIPSNFENRHPPEELREHMKVETRLIDDSWKHVSSYYTGKLQSNIKAFFLVKVLKGIILNLNERKKQCETFYMELCKACTHKSLKSTLKNIRAQAQNAGRGIWGRSELNDDLIDLINKILLYLKQSKKDYDQRLKMLQENKELSDTNMAVIRRDEKIKQHEKNEETLSTALKNTNAELNYAKDELKDAKEELKDTREKLETKVKEQDTTIQKQDVTIKTQGARIDELEKQMKEFFEKYSNNQNQSGNDGNYRPTGPGMFGNYS